MPVANPWLAENWNVTAQGDYVKKYGVSVAVRTAKLAGSYLGALKPNTPPTALYNNLVIIQRKSFGGGGIIGAGSSGDGPPE